MGSRIEESRAQIYVVMQMLMKARKTATDETDDGPSFVRGWGGSRPAPPPKPEPSNDDQVPHNSNAIAIFIEL